MIVSQVQEKISEYETLSVIIIVQAQLREWGFVCIKLGICNTVQKGKKSIQFDLKHFQLIYPSVLLVSREAQL